MSVAVSTLIVAVPAYIAYHVVTKVAGDSWGLFAAVVVMAILGGLEIAITVVILTVILLWLGSFFK